MVVGCGRSIDGTRKACVHISQRDQISSWEGSRRPRSPGMTGVKVVKSPGMLWAHPEAPKSLSR